MKQFSMSMYLNKEDLYKAKAEYYQVMLNVTLERLKDLEEISLDENDEWMWTNCGEPLV